MVYTTYPYKQYMVNGKMYKDPIQGTSLPNCGFIAGIASRAWVNPALIPNVYVGMINGLRYYQFKFYNTTAAAWGTVNASEMVDTVGAYSSDPLELWPTLYEKAYAGWVLAGEPVNQTIVVDVPILWNISWANSELIMKRITGNNYATDSLATYTANQIRALINNRNPLNNALIAWTYHDAPLSGSYDNNNIIKDHAYSVLGVHPGADYVILRNPYGPSKGDPIDPAIVLTAGSVTLAGKQIIYLSTTSDGIFALKFATFQTHFDKLAYTT
jgi:hypothetical protein